MINLGSVLLFAAAVIIIQVCLSMSSNQYLGLIIPGVNFLGSLLVSLLFTDMFSAILIFVLTSVPTLINLGIYKVCRMKYEMKKADEINRMKISDL